MKIAELVMAVALALLSLAIIWKSGEAPWGAERFSNVGFNDSGAPAGGFWPFWVATIMLVCAVWAFVNGFLTIVPVRDVSGQTRTTLIVILVVLLGYPVYAIVRLLIEAIFTDAITGSEGAIAIGHAIFAVCAWLIGVMVVFFLLCFVFASRDQRRSEPYLDWHGIKVLLTVGVPVFLLVFLTEVISIYFSMTLFLLYYMLILGRHPLVLSVSMALVLPMWMYLFFDITMTTTLPKGMLAIENAVYSPLGTWFRGLDGLQVTSFYGIGLVLLVMVTNGRDIVRAMQVGLIERIGDLSGRSSRYEFWMLWVGVQMLGLALLPLAAFVPGLGLPVLIVWALTTLALIPAMVRRLHDTNRPGWMLLVFFVPILGVVVLVWLVSFGVEGDNDFGPPSPITDLADGPAAASAEPA